MFVPYLLRYIRKSFNSKAKVIPFSDESEAERESSQRFNKNKIDEEILNINSTRSSITTSASDLHSDGSNVNSTKNSMEIYYQSYNQQYNSNCCKTYRKTSSLKQLQKVLILDSDPISRKMLNRLLAKRGYTSDEAIDGHACIHMIKKSISNSLNEYQSSESYCYDAVIVNINCGDEWIKSIRELGYNSGLVKIRNDLRNQEHMVLRKH